MTMKKSTLTQARELAALSNLTADNPAEYKKWLLYLTGRVFRAVDNKQIVVSDEDAKLALLMLLASVATHGLDGPFAIQCHKQHDSIQ